MRTVVLGALRDFCPSGQKHILLRQQSYAAKGGIVPLRFSLSLVLFLSLLLAIKEKEMNILRIS